MPKHGTILLVEDDQNDVFLLKKAFSEAEVYLPIHHVGSGHDAIQYLSGQGTYADAAAFPRPFLILMDLRMPGADGFVLLRWLYDRPGLKKKFTTVVLSAGSPGAEIQLAYELGAQSFLLKPNNYKQLISVVQRIKEYWIDLNVLPDDEL